MKGITVSTLLKLCQNLKKNGYGDKTVLISDDDEGNGYHTLFYEFTTDPDTLQQLSDYGMFHDRNNPVDIVILG